MLLLEAHAADEVDVLALKATSNVDASALVRVNVLLADANDALAVDVFAGVGTTATNAPS